MAFQAMISGKYKIRILWDLKEDRAATAKFGPAFSGARPGPRKSRRAC